MEGGTQRTPGPRPLMSMGSAAAILMARLAAAAFLAVSAFFGWVFHERYWRWRDCFNELGRCWDVTGEQVYLAQAGVIWGALALLSLAAAVALMLCARRRRS